MKLSRTVAYAVQATLQLAKHSTSVPVPCSQLASEGKMPERFLLQILRNLVTHGILRSTRGVEGGYALMRPPEDISLLEVIEAIEGPLQTEAPVADGVPEDSQHKLRQALRQVTATSRQQLEAIKLSQLLEPPQQASPEQASPEQASPEQASPEQASPENPLPEPSSKPQPPEQPSPGQQQPPEPQSPTQ